MFYTPFHLNSDRSRRFDDVNHAAPRVLNHGARFISGLAVTGKAKDAEKRKRRITAHSLCVIRVDGGNGRPKQDERHDDGLLPPLGCIKLFTVGCGAT